MLAKDIVLGNLGGNMNNVTIIMDTREKLPKKQHIISYLKRHNIDIERKKLNVGDYCIKGNNSVVIDLKQNILELAGNFFCDKIRFESECIRAKTNNILLIFLIEEQCDKEKLLRWRSPKNVNGKRFLNVFGWQIYNEMKKYSKLYNVKFRFCHKLSTGKKILELLDKKN